jgi:hypothetical protein
MVPHHGSSFRPGSLRVARYARGWLMMGVGVAGMYKGIDATL